MEWQRPNIHLARGFDRIAPDTVRLGTASERMTWTSPSPLTCPWPADLADWVSPRVLVDLALEASQTAVIDPRSQRRWTQHGGNPRALLSILLYGFSRGIYASKALSQEILEDPALAYLSVNQPLPAEQLQRFRRAESAALRQALETVLKGAFEAWHLAQPATDTAIWRRDSNAGAPALMLCPREEAEVRIYRAIRWDSMDGDC